MEGPHSIGQQPVSPYSGDSGTTEPASPEGRSGDKKVASREATRYLPRKWLFGDNPISSPYRYRRAALPSPGETGGLEDKLAEDTYVHLDLLKSTLKNKKNHSVILSGQHYLYNWLIIQARQIEKGLSGNRFQRAEARHHAACIDRACGVSGFNWRNLTLGLNYQKLKTIKEKQEAASLFKDDDEEKTFQLSESHVFLPPWTDTMVGNYPMAQIYDAYWEIRQRLGSEESGVLLHKEDFAALFPSVVEWLKDFERLACEHPDISQDHIEAFKYLLDQCDRYPNAVKGNPGWTWRDLIAIEKPASCSASEDVIAAVEEDERIVEIAEQINSQEPGSLTISIPRTGLQGKFQPGQEPSVSPGMKRKQSTQLTPEPEKIKRPRMSSPPPESSSALSQERSFESQLPSGKARQQWRTERDELLFLNPGLKFQHSGTGFKRWFPEAHEELEFKSKLDLDTYEFVALPSMCVEELLNNYDDYLACDDLVKETPSQWIKPRLTAMGRIFEVIDSRLNELKQMTGKKLTAMQKSGFPLQYGPQIYQDYCKTIDAIRERYILYNETVKAFAQAVGTDAEGEARKELEQAMSQPEGWVLQALMSDSEWQKLLKENQDSDS